VSKRLNPHLRECMGVGSTEPNKRGGAGFAGAGAGPSGVGSTEPNKSGGAGFAGAGAGPSGVGSTEPKKSGGAGFAGTGAKPALPLRRNRDFILLRSGQVVSTLGSEVSGLAFPLLVLSLTGSPAQAGIVGFARGLPYLLVYLPAGALVDRWNRKQVMLAADAGRAVAIGSVAVWLFVGRPPIAWLAVVSFVEGALFIFFQLAESAALPHIVPKEQLPLAIAQNQARVQGAQLAGGPLGGVLFGVARVLPFAADAASYAVSFISLLFVRPAFQESRERPPTRLRTEVAEGMRWLWNQPFLRTATLLVAGTNFVHQGLFGIVLIVRARELGASPALIGALFAFGGVAALALLHDPIRLGLVLAVSNLVPVFNVVVGAYRYTLVPDRLLGRVQSASLVIAWGAIPLGSLFAGFVVATIGARETIVVLAAILLALALCGTASRSVRTVPQLAETAAVE
jgi:MFS family permease